MEQVYFKPPLFPNFSLFMGSCFVLYYAFLCLITRKDMGGFWLPSRDHILDTKGNPTLLKMHWWWRSVVHDCFLLGACCGPRWQLEW